MIHFRPPCLENTLEIDKYGLVVTGQARRCRRERTELLFECRFEKPDSPCRACEGTGRVRGSESRTVVHAPIGTRPVHLLLRLRQFICRVCGAYWREQPGDLLPNAGGKLTRSAVTWALAAVVLDAMSIQAASRNLGAWWNTVNDAVLTAGYEFLVADETRFEGVKTIGVDEHCWSHKGRYNQKLVTVVMDLTPRQYGRPARLLDMIPGRSKQVFKTWLNQQTQEFRDGVEVVAMDGFTGYKTAALEALGPVTTVMDPFHVVQLAGEKLTQCRQRTQQETLGRRGRSGDPLFAARKALLTSEKYLSPRGWDKVQQVITKHTGLFRIWAVYQSIIAAYRNPDKQEGRQHLTAVIDALDTVNTKGIPELATLRRTLKRRRKDILAYFTNPFSSNGPSEAINGRLEHLRGIALGFRNIQNYITRSLLHTGGFKHHLPSLL